MNLIQFGFLIHTKLSTVKYTFYVPIYMKKIGQTKELGCRPNYILRWAKKMEMDRNVWKWSLNCSIVF